MASLSSTHPDQDHHNDDDDDDEKKAAVAAIVLKEDADVAEDSSSANVMTTMRMDGEETRPSTTSTTTTITDLPPRIEEPHDSNNNNNATDTGDGTTRPTGTKDPVGETADTAAGLGQNPEEDLDPVPAETDPSASGSTRTQNTTTTTTADPPTNKLIVRCGFRGGSIAQFPGNLAYVQEMKMYRNEFLLATRQQNTTERDRIVQHFLERYTFVEDRTGRTLTLEQARDKMHKSLGDPRRKSSTSSSTTAAAVAAATAAAAPDQVASSAPTTTTSQNKNNPAGKVETTTSTPAEEEEEEQVVYDAAGKYLVQCGFRGGSIAKYPGNVAYVDEMKDYRGAYLNALEDSPERNEIIQHFLNRYAFVDYTTQKRIPRAEAVARIHRGLNDLRREIREPAASTVVPEQSSSSAGRLRLSRAAKEDAVTKIETIAALGTIPKNASGKSNSRSQLLTQQQQSLPSEAESDDDDDEGEEPVPDDDNDNDDNDDASSTGIPDEDADGLDEKGRLVVRCGEHRFRNWPGNVAYWHEMRDLRGDYLAATANGDERKWIIDNFLGNYVFVWGSGSSSHQKRLSTKEATEKIVISLRDSRKGVRVLDSDDENDGEIILEDPGLLDDEDEDVEQENEEPEDEQNEEDPNEEEVVVDDEDNNDAAAQEEEDEPDDEASSDAVSSTHSSSRKKIIVRLGQGHTKRPGNMAYVEEMTDRRGEFLDLDEDSPKRERIIQHFLRKYSFVNAGGHPTDESFAYQKIRLSLKDARMPTRRNSNRKRRRIR